MDDQRTDQAGGAAHDMQPEGHAVTFQTSDRLVASLGQLSKFASRTFFVALAVFFAIAFFAPSEGQYALIGALCLIALLLVSGIGCVVLLTAREIILLKRRRWRFSLRTLLILTAELAVILGIFATAIRLLYS
jgi:hypothetical protein